jgi:hypothetical protein
MNSNDNGRNKAENKAMKQLAGETLFPMITMAFTIALRYVVKNLNARKNLDLNIDELYQQTGRSQ